MRTNEYGEWEWVYKGGLVTEQPAPIPGRVKVIDRVHQDLQKRSIFGYQKYGTYLMTGNGRDALLDAYEESLDLVQYLAQCIMERAGE